MDEDIKGVLSPEPKGPPLVIRAADIIERGGRIRRRRKRLAVTGSALATVAVIAVGAFAVGGRGGEAPPVQPAGPGLSTVSPAPPPPAELAPPTQIPAPGPDGRRGTTTAPGLDPRATRSTPRSQPPGPTTTANPGRPPTASQARTSPPVAQPGR